MADHRRGLSDAWFGQWPRTDAYVASDGHANRIPLRLTSTNVIVYGNAKLAEVLKDFVHEDPRPVTVDGDVPVQLWCNNFTDTDCGPADRVNPYVATWYSFPVTPKSAPLDLTCENPFSYSVQAPEALVWCHRVRAAPPVMATRWVRSPPLPVAVKCGAFPSPPAWPYLSFEYPDPETVAFRGAHQGHRVISLSVKRPECVEGHVTMALGYIEVESGSEALDQR